MVPSNRVVATPLSANQEFKLRYPKYIKGSILAALALTALLVWLWPGYQAKPYKLRESKAFEIVEVAPPVDVPLPPVPKEVPRIPPIIEPADVDDPFDDPEPWKSILDDPELPMPKYTPPPDAGFVASSSLPKLVQFVKADYPEIARRSGLEGTVVIQALVNPRGVVEKTVVTQSAHPILDRAAMEAASRCRFTPAKQRTIAVRAWVAIPYRFRLN